jgi:fructose-1-phosphate kinase PfkB-like protein
MNVEDQNLIRHICLKNAEDLVTSAKALQSRGVDHICISLGRSRAGRGQEDTLLQTKLPSPNTATRRRTRRSSPITS